jgi:protein-L-isoaspartate O-methyltransferase
VTSILTPETALFLLTPPGRALLTEADALRADKSDMLIALTRLRRSASPEQASAAWEMSELRKRGTAKFGPLASEMYFVREALEQASGSRIADYHAARLKAAGAKSVCDLGGGIGGDALAFARAGLRVTLIERDLMRAAFAEENVRVCGFSNQITVVQGDLIEAELPVADAAWLDPARRRNSRRVSDPEEYSPPLSWLHQLSASPLQSIGVKLSPAIDHELARQFGAELEFISEGGECREALLWLGKAQSGHALSATLLTPSGPLTLTGTADVRGHWTAPAGRRFLYEPDPAVIRAHLIGTLAAQLEAAPVDPQIAYLLGDMLVSSEFSDAYEILDQFPYGKKRLQEALTALNAGRVIIKKRGFPQEPDEIRKSLKLRGSDEIIVVLAHVGAGHTVYLCRQVQ